MNKQLYVLALSDEWLIPQVIPFWWDGIGSDDEITMNVLSQCGAEVVGETLVNAILAMLEEEPDGVFDAYGIRFYPVPLDNTLQLGGAGACEIPFTLKDKGERQIKRIVAGKVYLCDSDLAIHLDGYEQAGTETSAAENVVVELFEGRLRLLAWNDRASEDPAIVEMDGARVPTEDE